MNIYVSHARALRRFELIDIELNSEGGIRAVGNGASIWLGLGSLVLRLRCKLVGTWLPGRTPR
jgi:hypothetical protein